LRYLRDHTDLVNVAFLLDVAWVQRGGGDPAAVAREFLPRIAYFHLKDSRGTEWLELGEGDVDLDGVIEVMSGVALPWAVVEQDETKRKPVESAQMSRAFLRKRMF
jgi:sugar phosphate isomerase/epimerase